MNTPPVLPGLRPHIWPLLLRLYHEGNAGQAPSRRPFLQLHIGRFASVSSVFMDLSQLSQEQFKELVRGIVDDRLRELLGDPDLGLQLGDGLRARLKESLSSRDETVRRGHRGPARSPLVRTPWPGIVLPIAQPSS